MRIIKQREREITERGSTAKNLIQAAVRQIVIYKSRGDVKASIMQKMDRKIRFQGAAEEINTKGESVLAVRKFTFSAD